MTEKTHERKLLEERLRRLRLEGMTHQPRPEGNHAKAFMSGAAQGVTLGAADEIQAGAMSLLPGRTYDTQLREIRARNDAHRQNTPTAFSGGEILGAVGTSLVPMGAALSAGRGAGMATRALLGGVTGAGLASAQGFLSGRGEADRTARAHDPVAVSLGAGLGAGAPVLGRAVGGAIRSQLEKGAPALREMGMAPGARRILNEAFTADANVSPEAIQGYLQRLGPDATLADGGANLRETAAGVVAMPGAGKQKIMREIEGRSRSAPTRINQTIDEQTGRPQDIARSRRITSEMRSADGSPLYEQALDSATAVDVSGVVELLGEIPKTKAAGHRKVSRILTEIGEVADDGQIPPRTLHNLRSSLSDDIAEAQRAGRAKEVATLKRAIGEIDGVLDGLPGYAEGRQIWADSHALDRAMGDGQELFKPKTRVDDLRERWKTMSEMERQRFKEGARDQIEQQLGNATQEGNQAVNLLTKRSNQEKLALVFGEDSASALGGRVEAEKAFRDTRARVTQNSNTAARQSQQRRLTDLTDDAGNRLPPITRAKRAMFDNPVNAMADALMKTRSPQSLEQLADALVARGADRDRLIGALTNDQSAMGRAKHIGDVSERSLEKVIRGLGRGATQLQQSTPR